MSEITRVIGTYSRNIYMTIESSLSFPAGMFITLHPQILLPTCVTDTNVTISLDTRLGFI